MKKIRIVSPAKSIDQHPIDVATDFLKKQGFEVEIGTYALAQDHYFSGTIEERLSDFQYALDDPNLDVILCSRGGYGSVQLIDQLDFSAFQKKPKLIIGYSDITVFHNHVPANYGLPTVHAAAPLNFEEASEESLASLVNVLNGQKNEYHIAPTDLNISGTVTAEITGGNLAIIHALIGTNSDANYQDKILFIEEVGEAVYAIDRMFYSLRKSGKLCVIKGLIVGGLTNVKDSEVPYGLSAEEVILRHVKELEIPVCFNFPAGHISDNRAVIIGKEATLTVEQNGVIFAQ